MSFLLFDALIFLTDTPRPWVSIRWRVRWWFFCWAVQIGSTLAKKNGEWLLGVSLLAQIKEPAYTLAMHAGEKLTSFKPLDLNWLLSSCSARATVLLFIICLQESTDLSGISSLSKAESKRIIWMEESWRFLNWFLLVPSILIMCSICFMMILFCSSCLSAWHNIIVLRRSRTPVCCKPFDQPRDAAWQEECSDLDEKSLTTFCRCDGRGKGIC